MIIALVGVSAGRPLNFLPSKIDEGERQPLQTIRPFNIAHRGSNGEIPEETAPAYMVYIMHLSLLFLYDFPSQIWV